MRRLRIGLVACGVLFGALIVAIFVRIVTVWTESPGTTSSTSESEADAVQGTTAADGGAVGEVLEVVGTLDSFERPNDAQSLGSIPNGPRWFSDAGTWGVSNGQAYVSGPVDGRNHAVVDLGDQDGLVQVQLNRVVNGAGLVFRYQSPFDYWAVVAVPTYATWAIVQVVDGEEMVVANTGLSPIADGTVVAVRTEDDVADIALDGRVVATVDTGPSDATRVGVTAQAIPGIDAAATRFDNFAVALLDGRSLPTTPDQEAGPAPGGPEPSPTTVIGPVPPPSAGPGPNAAPPGATAPG